MSRRIAFAVVLFVFCESSAFAAARISILNGDRGTSGFNDPTPVAPVGGNSGTTLGEQRLIAFRHAAEIWEKLLDSPVEIQVLATFAPIRDSGVCSATTGVLGAARSWAKVADFENAPRPGILYPIALANKLAGRDLMLGQPDIEAFFNSDVDTTACLGDRDWYYGLDGNAGDDVNLVVVLLHEFAHGLGMSGSMNFSTGVFPEGKPSIFEVHALDLTTGLRFDQLTSPQRRAAVTGNNTVWDGEATRDAATQLLRATTSLSITAPDSVAGSYELNPAAFGPRVDDSPVAGRIVAALDAADTAGPTTLDGCSAYTNAPELAGRVVLVDRGECTFVEKTLRAQEAGAIAVIVVDNVACTLPPMGGESTAVTIPAIGIRKIDGDRIRAQLADGVDGALRLDPSRRAGASATGFVKLYVPCTLEAGSSMYHWDTSATPNLLMEPFVNEDLPHGVDLTLQQLLDIGWTVGTPSGRRVLRRR
jgi:hypothetical protein